MLFRSNQGLPYEENELKELIALAAVDWENFDSDFDNDPEESDDSSNEETSDCSRYTLAIPNHLVTDFDTAMADLSPDASATSTEEVLGSKVLKLLGILS